MPVQSQTKNLEVSLKIANQLKKEGRWDEAIAAYTEAIQLEPNNASLYASLGQAQAQTRDFAVAIASYQKAIQLGLAQPFWTYKNLGDALREENRADEAIAAYTEAIKLEPDNHLGYRSLGQAQAQTRDIAAAIKSYQKAIELNPQQPTWVYKNLGYFWEKQGELDKTLSAQSQVVKHNPNFAYAYLALGEVLAKQERWNQAASAYKKAIEIAPQLPSSVYESLGEVLSCQTQSESEVISSPSDKNRTSKSAQEYLKLADKCLKENKLTEAVTLYKKAIAIEFNAEDIYLKLGDVLVKLNKYGEAISTYQEAIAIKPDAKTYHLLAITLEKTRNWQEVINAYNCAIKLNPDYYFYHHRLGNFCHKVGDIEQAISAYHRAIELNPEYVWVHYHLGEALQDKGELKAAISCYQTAVKIQPDFQRALTALNNALGKQQQIENQLSSSRQKVKIKGENLSDLNLVTQSGLKIVFYPRFQDKKSYTDHFYRMIWYLNPLIEQIEKITIPVGFEDINPDECPSYLDQKSADFYARFAHKINFSFANQVDDFTQEIKSANFILRWHLAEQTKLIPGDPGMELIKTKKVWRIDHHQERYAGSFYLKCVVENDRQYEKNIAESQEKFQELAELIRAEQGFIFGTGPSLSQAYNFRFDNGESIACNSMLKNRTLMEYLSPKLIVAADPIFHAGCSSYAADFRKYLCDALEYFQSYLIVPMRDLHIYKHNLPQELTKKIIGIPFQQAEQPNLNLLEQFHVTSTGNVLTLYLLPLAATLFDKIGIAGCDGRPLQEDKYFWKHDPSSQFVNKMSVIQDAHGAFFAIDYNDYYLTHCDILQKWLTAAEGIGKEVRNLTPSYIPALQKRSFSSGDQPTLPTWVNTNGAKAFGQPLVSIIMPARNAAETIATSIASIQKEELKEWEVIIINDGSADDTVTVVEQIRKVDPRVAIYHTAGRGVSFARNLGLSVARGKYIGFLDADDLFEEQALTKRVKALEQNSSWEGVYCRTEIVDDSLDKLGWSVGAYQRKITFADMHSNIHLASVVAKADVLRRQAFKVGLANGEDWLYLSQVLRSGTELEYVADCNVAYRIHERSTVLQDFTAHETKLLEVIDTIYGVDPECSEPAEKYNFGLYQAPNKQIVVLKRRVSLLSFLLLSRKARQFYECAQASKSLPWDSLDQKSIVGGIRSTTMRYYACPQERWQEKLQQNKEYIRQVLADLKLANIIPHFCQTLSAECL